MMTREEKITWLENATNEDEWGLDTAFKLIDDRISYQALTKIRELKKLGIDFYFE